MNSPKHNQQQIYQVSQNQYLKESRVKISFLNVITVKAKNLKETKFSPRKQHQKGRIKVSKCSNECYRSVHYTFLEYMFFHNAATRWWKPYGKSIKYKLLSSAFLWLFVYCTKILKSEHFSERY